MMLKGMTWSHPRGFDPLVACSTIWRAKTGVEVVWDRRSLQDFESYPVSELAARYDLIVLDHPHVGQVTAEGCLHPLDDPGLRKSSAALAAASVGASFASYRWRGRQWALPIDAAAQVQAWRADRMEAPLKTWDDVIALARRGLLLWPLRPPHALLSLFTLAAHRGAPLACEREDDFLAGSAVRQAYDDMAEVVALLDPKCFEMDPIAALEALCEPDAHLACAPFVYGYVSYARSGFRAAPLAFANIPVTGERGPTGSTLGGTGVAVSSRSAHIPLAADFAYWIAGEEVQRTIWAAAGGQPAHGSAWSDSAVNEAAGQFYRATRATLEGAWVRPRHDGYMLFQQEASERLNIALQQRQSSAAAIADLNRMYSLSFLS